jgi:NAD(P)-dependent dehydrogenase (short-subunit alcohol dehydrogenase family)
MNLELINKTALISGSTKGIGFAIASQLASEGARIIVNGRSDKAVHSALEQIRNQTPEAKVEGFAGDLSTEKAAEDLLKRFPAVDILVNNLGIYEPKRFEEITDEEWRRFFEINVLSGVRLSRAYVSGMKERKWGRVIFMSSESALNTPKEMVHYARQRPVVRGL